MSDGRESRDRHHAGSFVALIRRLTSQYRYGSIVSLSDIRNDVALDSRKSGFRRRAATCWQAEHDTCKMLWRL